MELGVYELDCLRRHHRLFLVFSSSLTRMFVVTTLSLHGRRSIGWTILSSTRTRPPSSSTSFDCLTSRLFIAFQLALDTTREIVFVFLIFASCRSPPLSFSLSLIVSLGPPPPLHPPISLNLYLSLGFNGLPGRTTSTFTYTRHKYTTYDPRLFRVLRSSFNIDNPIPSSISICLYLYIDIVHTHLSYNHRLRHRHLYTTSTHSHMANPYGLRFLYSPFFHTYLYLPTSSFLHSVILSTCAFSGYIYMRTCIKTHPRPPRTYLTTYLFRIFEWGFQKQLDKCPINAPVGSRSRL